MKAPEFWYRDVVDAGPLSTLLIPAGAVWSTVTRMRIARAKPLQLDIPVICVGNLTAGGSGKTPIVAELAGIAREQGLQPHILMRGYGGKIKGPERVDPAKHGFKDVGDEALVLAASAPVWVSCDRAAGAQAARAAGARMIIMDDGFQNPDLHKDLSLIVVDGESGFGNGRIIPAGPLRESVETGIKRADAIIIMGPDRHNIAEKFGETLPVIRAETEPSCTTSLWGRETVAFAGIGRPGKFRTSLEWLGANISGFFPFPDHHVYSQKDFDALKAQATEYQAALVTTRKDFVRLPPEMQELVDIVDIDIRWSGADDMPHLLEPLFRNAREHRHSA